MIEYLKQCRDAARQGEDIIDEYVSLVAVEKRGANLWVRNFSHLLERRRVAKEIKQVKRRFEEIYNSREKFGIPNFHQGYVSTLEDDSVRRRKRFLVEETDVVGFEEDAQKIIERLTKGEVGRDVVPIVGMGGIGKTTLAWKVYNNPNVVSKFSFRAWVNVCPKYKVRDLLLAILKSAMGVTTEFFKDWSDDVLAMELRKYLRTTPYLIVLDDVWVTDLWEELSNVFTKNIYGSRIILTTRDDDVARHVNSSSPAHRVHFLNPENSRKLFFGRIFPGETCPNELEVLGIQMVDKCGGLPLAIVVLAGVLLKNEKTENWWTEVSTSVSSFLNQGTDRCSKMLALSYDNLPRHLRPCFLYLSIFPKHRNISGRRLVKFWIAEGFVQKNDRRSMEEDGNDYLKELIARNLIQISNRRFDGSLRSCFIHDLLQDLAISKAKDEIFLKILTKKDSMIPSDTPRLSFHSIISRCLFSNPSKSKLRSILCFDLDERELTAKEWRMLEKHYPLLKVLDLWDVGVESIPKGIDKFVHLRYLRLKSLKGENLPATICQLWNLQTLEVTAPCIDRPWINIWKMKELRHLYFQGQVVIPEPPANVSRNSDLENLLTLSGISPDSCKETTVSKWPNLVKLGINGDLKQHMAPAFEHLCRLVSLRTLKLERDRRCDELTCLPSAARFPPNITKLTLSETQLLEDPMLVLGELPNLHILKLENAAYSGQILASRINGFPKLQVLKLMNMAIQCWTISEGSMLSLASVVIRGCGKLDGLPSLLQRMPAFVDLELWSPHASVVKEARKIEDSKGKEKFKLVIYQS